MNAAPKVRLEGDIAHLLATDDLTVIARDLGGGEGPVWHPAGYLTFVDRAKDQLLKWEPQAGVSVLRAPNFGGNGCTLDHQHRLVMCESGNRRIVRREHDGSWSILADSWNGKRLNHPNDIITRSDGTIFFTDPDMFLDPGDRDLGTPAVWALSPGGTLTMVGTECSFPNGLALSPDETRLYVTSSFLDRNCLHERENRLTCRHRFLTAYDVGPGAALRNFRVLTDMTSAEFTVPDGLRIDRNGVIFCAGSGATWVLSPDGDILGKIWTPQGPRNCAFGGKDMRTLFLVSANQLYSIDLVTPGIGPA